MKEFNYQILVAIVNVILLGFICLFFLIASFSVSAPIDDPIDKVSRNISTGFIFILWAVNFWLQFKSKKKKWYLPLAGTVLYVAIVFIALGYVSPFIRELLIK
ncbi:hypothetical protein DVB69_00240 [Sporosarcina sp. BI001-red]|uniref:hypothetical protein n=1 Tax=unclassified Sporosarcina TaxID=2647733 RepID=UPI000E2270DD|nr:hypothetical protein [Sporosarcina sp. BI001-red]REB11609.1 hypothetical protein DVB69_00240 [Sporosarcina sp. BI001-red]